MSDMSVAFTPSPGQPLCFTSTETKETVSVGVPGVGDFFAFGEEGEEEDFLEGEEGEGEVDFFESERGFGLRIGSPLLGGFRVI
jgi:hypothetical protein